MSFLCKVSAWPFCSRIFFRFHVTDFFTLYFWNFWVIEIALIQIACFYSWKKFYVLFRVISLSVIFSTAADCSRFRSVSRSRRKFDAIIVNLYVFFFAKFPLDRFVREFFLRFHFTDFFTLYFLNFWVIEIALIQIACFYSWKKFYVLFRVISLSVIFSTAADCSRFRSVSRSRRKFDAIIVNLYVFFLQSFRLTVLFENFFSGFTSLTFSRFTS